MRTEELIDRLTADLRPVSVRAVGQYLALGVALGGGVALAVLLAALGVRPDFDTAFFTSAFWLKWLYTVALAIPAFALALRYARPVSRTNWSPLWMILPLLALGIIAVVDALQVPPEARLTLWLGHSALVCPLNIMALSLPVFGGSFYAFRRFAPTHLQAAGFAAGLLSGAVGAFVYALYCTENAPAFVVTWYTLGMLLPAGLGTVLAPRLMRW